MEKPRDKKKDTEGVKHVAIVFGKLENKPFERYTFPILGRPVARYPLLAACHSKRISKVFLSSDDEALLHVGESMGDVVLLRREKSQPSFMEEVRNALGKVREILGAQPESITILLANSPCVTSTMLDNAIEKLEEENVSSVVSAMKREEFNPERLFTMDQGHRLHYPKLDALQGQEVYFLDHRLICLRTRELLKKQVQSEVFESLLGKEVLPLIQTDGIWDIDYIWQVPIVERWLRLNGFSESSQFYAEKNRIDEGPVASLEAFPRSTDEPFRVLVTTIPFGKNDPTPIDLLQNHDKVELIINPTGRKLIETESINLIKKIDILIAGTEINSERVLRNAPNLKLISRVGIGVDAVDLNIAREMGIAVSYTPDAPSPAVAELTMALILGQLRNVSFADRKLRSGIWQRYSGERLNLQTVGILGTGRIGSIVLQYLQGFRPHRILVHDLEPKHQLYEMFHAEYVDLETLYRDSDILSLHLPLTRQTYNMIGKKELAMMKDSITLVNTSRGGIINEDDLYVALQEGVIGKAAIDVFEEEPYVGPLVELDNCLLTCHMGSMTVDCRIRMELEATQEVIRFIDKQPLISPVPEREYEVQALMV